MKEGVRTTPGNFEASLHSQCGGTPRSKRDIEERGWVKVEVEIGGDLKFFYSGEWNCKIFSRTHLRGIKGFHDISQARVLSRDRREAGQCQGDSDERRE